MLVTLVAGIGAIAVAALSVFRVRNASNPLSWLAVFFFSVLVAGAAYGATHLFGVWGMMIRRLRLMEERFKGAMSVSSITAYEERENKRKNDMETVVSDNMGNIRTAINENMTRYKTDLTQYYQRSHEQIEALKSELKKRNSVYERQRQEEIERRNRDAAMLESIISILRSEKSLSDTDKTETPKATEQVPGEEAEAVATESSADNDKAVQKEVVSEFKEEENESTPTIPESLEPEDPVDLGDDNPDEESDAESSIEGMFAKFGVDISDSPKSKKHRKPKGGEEQDEDEALYDSY